MAAVDLQINVEDDEIVVTKPGTAFLLGYRKSVDAPRLVLTRSWMASTPASKAMNEFRGQAFQAAVTKARELGWICKARPKEPRKLPSLVGWCLIFGFGIHFLSPNLGA
jgi:hypothetical protein